MAKIQVFGGGGTDKTVYVGINAKRRTCKTFKGLNITDALLQTCAPSNVQLSPHGSQSLGNSNFVLEKKKNKTKPNPP